MKQVIIRTILSFLFFALGGTNAYAQGWFASASGCVPRQDAIQKDLFKNSLGGVTFMEGKTGTIVLTCNVDRPVSASHLYLTFKNAPPEGIATKFEVRAVLKRRNNTTGNITNVVAIGSESYPGAGEDELVNAKSIKIPDKELPLDLNKFKKNFYYVVVIIRRDTTEKNPVVFGVALR